MKKILTLFLALALILASAGALVSCGADANTPDGMQIVAGGDELGYYFYAPEGWSVSNVGGIKSAFVSRIDTTSVTFTEVDPFASTDGGGKDKDAYFFEDYFADSLSEFATTPTVSNNGEEILFGKSGERADRAKRYTFSYDYYDPNADKTYSYAFMQILIKAGGKYYIFQYSGSLENRNGTQTTYYDYHLGSSEDKGDVMKIMEEFRFVTKSGEPSVEAPVYDEDGFLLVSDIDISGFSLSAPTGFSKNHSLGMASASHTDGSNLNMTEAMGTNENVNAYVLRRLEELAVIATDITYEYTTDEDGRKIVNYEQVNLGNADAANAYRYSYTYNGERILVYQVIAINRSGLSYKGYVFTYTAKEANFEGHLDGITKAMEKVVFK